MKESHMVTGAFGYSGKYIAKQLIEKGYDVSTLTNSTSRNHDFGDRIKVFPFHFDNPEKLYESLRGVSVLYNNYWVRFNHKLFTHADAIKNTFTLFDAAKKAGVARIIHVSITNPENDLQLEYFQGKAVLEEKLKNLGVSYAIVRPAVIFGKEDVLINNIAWALRRFPVFGIFGTGEYGIQPIYVEDLAKLALEQGQKRENCIINAIGPESFSYLELVKTIRNIIGVNTSLLHLPPWICYIAVRIISLMVGDTFLTKEEIKGLMGGTLAVNTPPVGTTKLTEWIENHKDFLGNKYTNEVARRKDRKHAYRSN